MTGLVIGEDESGAEVRVTNHRMPAQIMGLPGTGKTHLLAFLAEQLAGLNEGVLVLDHKDGQLARDLAGRTEHVDKLVYVAPGLAHERGRTWGLNVLDGPP